MGINLATLAPPSFASLPTPFSALKELQIDKFPVDWILEVLKVVQSPELSHIRISRVIYSGKDGDFCEVIASRSTWRRSIRSIELSFCELSSREIEHLLAGAWPRLQQLHCVQHALHTATHTATLRSLISFSKHCPDLKYLNIPLDANQIPPLVDAPSVSLDQDSTTDVKPILVVRAFPFHQIPDAASLADFLLGVFPRVRPHIHCVLSTPSLEELIWEGACKIVNARLGRASGEEAIPWNWRG
ncbi:hypothetical protein JVU11DRAFT_3113 [Chiua virens]|nr:hypothetical protein JVU11DRAFT_3113 [Chiua virens]